MKNAILSSTRGLLAALGLTALLVSSVDAASLTFAATKDATTKEKFPSTNYGTETTLQVSNQAMFRKQMFLQFAVSGIPVGATNIAAQLMLTSQTTATGRPIIAHTVSSTTWGETAVVWNNKPAFGASLSTVSSHTSGQDSIWTVSSLVIGNGTYAIGLDTTFAGDTTFASREGAAGSKPELLVTYDVGGGIGNENMVAICDLGGTQKILLLDPNGSWNLNSAIWSWKASDSPQIQAAHRAWFKRPIEAKLRDNGATLLAASGSLEGTGGVAIVRVSDKAVLFYALGGGGTHSVERLPDGNLVSVSTTDNIIRVMSTDPVASPSPTNVEHTDYVGDLPHGVVWDPREQLLWINGNHGLDAYTYNNNRLAPKLSKRTDIRIPFGDGSAGGHDLYPILGQRKLFVTNNAHIYSFDIATRALSYYAPDHSAFKAVGLNGAGRLVGNTLTQNVFFATPGGSWVAQSLPNANVYKARWWRVTELAP